MSKKKSDLIFFSCCLVACIPNSAKSEGCGSSGDDCVLHTCGKMGLDGVGQVSTRRRLWYVSAQIHVLSDYSSRRSAGKRKDPVQTGSTLRFGSPFSSKLVVCGHCLVNFCPAQFNETMVHIAAHLNAKIILVVSVKR